MILHEPHFYVGNIAYVGKTAIEKYNTAKLQATTNIKKTSTKDRMVGVALVSNFSGEFGLVG